MDRPFLNLVEQSQIGRVAAAIETAVTRSFAEDGARPTGDEVRRRFRLCESLFRRLRGDLGWGIERIAHHLPHYLRCQLDRQSFEPDRRTIWMPEDGN